MNDTIQRLRHAGIEVSDRRAVKLQRLIAASAVLSGRTVAQVSDLWVLRFIWDTEEQQGILKTIIDEIVTPAAKAEEAVHPQATGDDVVDPEQVARDLARIDEQLNESELSERDQVFLRDRLSLLTERCQWVPEPSQRSQLEELTSQLWKRLEAT